jgi:hypothetical protein
VESGGCHEFRRSASAKQVSMIIPGAVFLNIFYFKKIIFDISK